MIEGARRVGKSFIVEEFAKSEYESYLVIDFAKAKKSIKEIFEDKLDDLDDFSEELKEQLVFIIKNHPEFFDDKKRK